jgi:glutathione reductase (NADPH)
MPYDFDLFVIGGGSGGVRCARIAATHGARVGIAESTHWGGTCVNVGCVPKKLMVMAADYGIAADDSQGFGWDTKRGTHDWPAFIAAKDAEISRLNNTYTKLLGDAGVEMFEARASFADAHTLDLVDAAGGTRQVTAERIVIAVGGHPVKPDIPGAELGIVSDAAFHLPTLPRRIVMIGAGYISVEFAGIFAGLGAEVDLICRQPLPLAGFDHDIREALLDALKSQGIRVHRNVRLHSIEAAGEQRRVNLTDGESIDTDLVFFATGRVPNVRGLGLDEAGVQLDDKGRVTVDALNQTSQANVFAIGDVSNRMNLTPVAIAEGHMLADRLFGPHRREWNFRNVATAVFSHPPIATIGLTEQQAGELFPADIYVTRFLPMRHVMTGRQVRTIMKLVVEQSSQRIVGAHMLGDDAAEMMQGIAVAVTAGATKQDFDQTIGIHPTGAEEWVTMRTRTRVVGAAEEAKAAE